MRLSPVLLAVCTVTAAVGLSSPATARSLSDVSQAETSAQPESSNRQNQQYLGAAQQLALPAGVGEPERFLFEGLAQAPVETAPTPEAEPAEELPLEPATPAEDEDAPVDILEPSDPTVPLDDTEPTAPIEEALPLETPDAPTPDAPVDEAAPDDDAPTLPELDLETEDPLTPSDEAAPTSPEAEPATPAEPEAQEARVLVAEVVVEGAEGELQDVVYEVIGTRPGRTTTRSQLQEDINAVFSTGYFTNVQAVPSDTPLGVRVTFTVDPNPVLTGVQLEGSEIETLEVDEEAVPLQQAVDDIFRPQYGRILNFRDFQIGVQRLNEIYQENGYVLAQVIDAPRVADDGTVTLLVAEGVIEDIEVRFLNEEGNDTDEEGKPVRGKTRPFIITREFESQSGDVFNQRQVQADLQRVFNLGIFEDVRISLNPGDDPRRVDMIVNVIERNTGSLAAGLGFSSSTGLFGTVSYQEQNFGGNNQRFGVEAQLGTNLDDFTFDVNFTDPWIGGDPFRTAYTVNVFNRRTISSIFDGGDPEVRLPTDDDDDDDDDGDRPRVNRLGGGISFSRPLDEWLGWDNWRGSLGLQFQQVTIRDSDGDISPQDEQGNDLSFSGDGRDELLTLQLALVNDQRNNPLVPTSGSLLRFSTEQSVPIGDAAILLNRLRASYSYYIPVDFTNFTEGAEALAFNIQGGTILGDLPPYEAFALGGTDSVRGYDFGELGSGRSFVQATIEYRFPIFSIVGGALFLDAATDLGTADDVPGSPAEIRGKPGSGFGYGVGVRVQTPLGQIRVDYGINDEGDSQFHFGLGERF